MQHQLRFNRGSCACTSARHASLSFPFFFFFLLFEWKNCIIKETEKGFRPRQKDDDEKIWRQTATPDMAISSVKWCMSLFLFAVSPTNSECVLSVLNFLRHSLFVMMLRAAFPAQQVSKKRGWLVYVLYVCWHNSHQWSMCQELPPPPNSLS